MRIFVATAVDAEREAILRGLGEHRANVDVVAVGVGPAMAAAGAAKHLAFAGADKSYRAVVSAGIAGGFPGRADIGSLVVSSRIVAADLGAETAAGFDSVDRLGFGSSEVPVDKHLVDRVVAALCEAGLRTVCGPIITVSTATGSAATADKLAARVPGASAEAMEGYGVAVAAQLFNLPVLEVRAISNAVGPRDRDAWRIGDALASLEQAAPIICEVMQR